MNEIDNEQNEQSVAQFAKVASAQHAHRAELRRWYFMRLSALLLIALALVHFVLTHLVNDVVETNADFVDGRWANPAWRVFDWLLLSLGLMHGTNGFLTVIEDSVASKASRHVLTIVVCFVVAFLFALGTLTVVTYKT